MIGREIKEENFAYSGIKFVRVVKLANYSIACKFQITYAK